MTDFYKPKVNAQVINISADATLNAAIEIKSAANITHLLDFNAASGCVTVNTACVTGTTCSNVLVIDINGTKGYIPVFAKVPAA